MKLKAQTFILAYVLSFCFLGCSADEEGPLDETLTIGDRDRILAKALDWTNLQLRGPERNEELIYEPNQETPYTGWVVRRWIWRLETDWTTNMIWGIADPGEESGYEEFFQVRNGKKDGVFTGWYESGQKGQEGMYKDGYPDGMWTSWYKNGQKYSEGTYKVNRPEDLPNDYPLRHFYDLEHGMWTFWYENGQKEKKGEYKNGERNGMWTFWYENGQKDSEGTYINGDQDDNWTYWNMNGEQTDYVDDDLLSRL